MWTTFGENGGRWQAVGASVRGAAHIRSERPNQDALRWWPRDGRGNTLVLAVADGHGGARYVRSHIGAWYAVRTAVRVLARDLVGAAMLDATPPDLPALKWACEEWLPKVLVRRWQASVERHAGRYPLRGEEQVAVQTGRASQEPAEELWRQAYGSTLLAVLLTPSFHLFLQLGDGDMLTVAPDGRVLRPPLAPDERILANETTSLCMADAWRSVRLYFQPLAAPPPALVLLATDGYANSFVSPEAFEEVGSDLLAAVRSEGIAAVGRNLPGWLQDTSAAGSGDDITVALAVRAGGE